MFLQKSKKAIFSFPETTKSNENEKKISLDSDAQENITSKIPDLNL